MLETRTVPLLRQSLTFQSHATPPLLSYSTASPSPHALNFYRNKQLELFASKPAKRLSLRQLIFFGRAMDEERLIKSANYVRMELPIRLAHRIRDMQALPYVVVTQESIAQVYELYWDAFEKFRRFPPINTLQDNERFCKFLGGLLGDHARVIPTLSLGLSLSSPHLPPDELDAFMQRMLVSRISRRVLAEHHIALSDSLSSPLPKDHVGIIYTNLRVRDSIEKCWNLLQQKLEREDPFTVFPSLKIDGHVDTKFAYIREHFEYLTFELLHNAIRFTRQYAHLRRSSTVPAIKATIVASDNDVHLRISDNGGGLPTNITSPSDLYSFSHVRNATRLGNDRLGALRTASTQTPKNTPLYGTVAEQLASTGTIDAGNDENSTTAAARARRGLGLPMSNIYATYFGGSLNLMSLDGWGTDVYLKLPKLGTNLEGLEV